MRALRLDKTVAAIRDASARFLDAALNGTPAAWSAPAPRIDGADHDAG